MKLLTSPATKAATLLVLPLLAIAGTLEQGDVREVSADSALLPLKLSGSLEVAGLQFDLAYPSALATIGQPTVSSAAASHQAQSGQISAGVLRVVVYSTSSATLPQDLILNLPIVLGAAKVDPGPLMVLSNIRFTDAQGNGIAATSRIGAVTAWKRTHFTTTELNDPTVSGDRGDPDDDGMENLMELLSGADPKAADSANRQPLVNRQHDATTGEPYMVLRWRKLKDLEGLQPRVEMGTELANWPMLLPSIPSGVEDETTIEMQAKVQMEGPERVFLRLTVQRQ